MAWKLLFDKYLYINSTLLRTFALTSVYANSVLNKKLSFKFNDLKSHQPAHLERLYYYMNTEYVQLQFGIKSIHSSLLTTNSLHKERLGNYNRFFPFRGN